jgi:hypothetical protein
LTAGIRLARERQVNVRVAPTGKATEKSVDLAYEILNRVFRKVPSRVNGKIMAFGFWQGLCRARLVLWLWNECRKRPRQRQLAVYCRRRESKMEILVKMVEEKR